MAKILASVSLSPPYSDIAVAVDATFLMSESFTLSGNGGTPTVILYWQYDQGDGTWIDIPTSGSTGLVADNGWQDPAVADTTYSRTVTCKSAGVYSIRARADASTPATMYSTNTPTVTVTVAPNAPTNMVTISKTDVQVVTSWTDNSNNETGFNCYQDGVLRATVGAGVTTYTFVNLSPSTQYTFTVKATDSGVESSAATDVETTSAEVGGTVFESNTTENGYGEGSSVGLDTGQTFTPQLSHAIYKVRLKLTKIGSPVGDMTVSIFVGATVICVSNAIAMASTLPNPDQTIYTFTFTTNPVLWAGAVYTMKLVCTGGDVNNYIGIRIYDSATIDIYPRGAATFMTPYCDWYFVECGIEVSGTFVAVAWGSTIAATSPDSITWTQRTLPISAHWVSVVYGNGMFVATTMDSDVIATSPDGITWTQRTLPISANWRGIAYGNGVFVTVAYNTNVAATSPDGITWTQRVLPVNTGWLSVVYGNGVFVAIAVGGNIAATSPDGITWTQRTLLASANWYTVTYGNGLFVVADNGGPIVITSPDGITWTSRMLPATLGWYSSAYGNGRFVITALNTAVCVSSPDGITWVTGNLPVGANWRGVTYGGGQFVVVAADSTIVATSLDGITWTQRVLPVSAGWFSVTFGSLSTLPPVIEGKTAIHSFPWWKQFRALCKVKEA